MPALAEDAGAGQPLGLLRPADRPAAARLADHLGQPQQPADPLLRPVPWPFIRVHGLAEGQGGARRARSATRTRRWPRSPCWCLHVAAALHHILVRKDEVGHHMLPFLRPPGAREELVKDVAAAAEALRARRAGHPADRDGLRPGLRRRRTRTPWPAVYEAKGRPRFNPLIAHVADVDGGAAARRLRRPRRAAGRGLLAGPADPGPALPRRARRSATSPAPGSTPSPCARPPTRWRAE